MLPVLIALVLGAAQVRRVTVAPAETLLVTARGEGTPVVMVPGLFGSSYGWRNVVSRLEEAGRLAIVIEPLAIGGSSRPGGADYSLTAQADRIAAVLDTLRIRGAVVVAHSTSAGMVMRLAVRRPDLVRAVVSLDGGPTEAAATPGFRRAMSMAPLIRLLGANRLRGRIRASLVASSGDVSWVTDEAIVRYTEGATEDLGATLRAFMAMAESREAMALAPRLVELRCPVFLLVGDVPHAGRVSDREVELLRSRVPAFTIDLVPGAGHYLQEERPDIVAAVVERALATASTVAGR